MPALRCFALAIVAIAISLSAAHAQTPTPTPLSANSQISAADLQTDVAVLRRAYESLHPGLYRYNTKAEMDARFAALASQLNHDQSLQDAYLAFSQFAATIRCGHTYANFFNQPKSVAAALFQSPTRVPFYFQWLGQRMIVLEDFTPTHQLPRGTEVLSINNVPVSQILQKLLTIARADGSNDAKRVASLSVYGDSLYETFDIYFPMFFPQKSTALQLSVRKPDAANAQEISVETLTYAQRIAPIRAREAGRKGGSEIEFDLSYLPDGAAYLKMPTWALYDSKWDWKSWLNAHLDELIAKNSPSLIIDLRGNEGGNDIGNEILPRLITSDLKLSATRRLVRYQKVPEDLVPYLDTWDPSFKDWGAAAAELPQPWPTAPPVHYFKLTRYDDDPDGDVIKPAAKHFSGKVFVLVDANNSSATFQFAQVIQQNHLGQLVGQPTGGNQRGINGGAFFFLRLPKSKIEMDLPLIGSFPATPRPDSGLTPDILVQPTIPDITANRDSALLTITRQN
jgi:hypothetical protein